MAMNDSILRTMVPFAVFCTHSLDAAVHICAEECCTSLRVAASLTHRSFSACEHTTTLNIG